MKRFGRPWAGYRLIFGHGLVKRVGGYHLPLTESNGTGIGDLEQQQVCTLAEVIGKKVARFLLTLRKCWVT